MPGTSAPPRPPRYVPAAALEWLEPGDRVPYGRARALEALLAAYTRQRRVLTGLALWVGAVTGALGLGLGGSLVAEGVATGEAGLAAVGVVLLVAGAALLVACARNGVALLRAGRTVTRAAVAWLGDTDRPRSVADHHLVRRSLYAGPVLVRLVLSSWSGLAAVLAASAVGFLLAELPGTDPADARLLPGLAVSAALVAVACAVPTVALARGAWRLQRVLVWRWSREG